MTEWRYVAAFAAHLRRCGLHDGEVVAILSETQSRATLVATARMAAQSLGGRVVDIVVPTPAAAYPVPIRSTGASVAIAGNRSTIAALATADLVIDCTVEGLLHAAELGAILGGGARVLMVSNEHPDTFDRLGWDDALPGRVAAAHARLAAAEMMRVTSPHGTDLTVRLAGGFTAGSTGLTDGPGSIAHWPGGLVLVFPAAHSVEGVLVLAPGDANLTFNRYVESPIRLTIVDDHIVEIAGDGVDAQLFRRYLGAFDDRPGDAAGDVAGDCASDVAGDRSPDVSRDVGASNGRSTYATSHVGWGMNRAARWEVLELYDKRELWGTELRAIEGSFLYSTGANERAGRFTAGHFDLPMMGCTIELDGAVVVEAGRVALE